MLWKTLIFLPPYSPDLNPIEQAYEALGVRTRIQAVVRARQLGLLR
jgi:transposase